MITQSIFSTMFSLFALLFNRLPQVTILPWGVDEILVQAVGSFKAFMAVFPPMQIVFNAFIIYISFRIGIRLLRAIPFFGRALE